MSIFVKKCEMSELTRQILQRYWGYPSFRPMQENIVDSVMSGCDTLALLPTGGGKSICFQVPAMAMDGVCIVVTPLISLMKDQVAHLCKIGIDAASVYTGLSPKEVEVIYNKAVFGRLKFLYVSPERLQTVSFITVVKQMKVCLLAIDESHCISQWGYDFRPPYLKIADLREYIPTTPVLALTATATPRVVEDIQFRLGFKKRNVFQTSYERKNVTYNVLHETDKYGAMYRLLSRMTSGSGIVYVRSRRRTTVIAEWLDKAGVSATSYHAGLDAVTRDERQHRWMDGEIRVMVATNAFGMGIDKPDVRLVVHLDLPDSLEAYFQEAGRAGRDLKPSEAFLLVSEADVDRLYENLATTYPPYEVIKKIYSSLGRAYTLAVGEGVGREEPFSLEEFSASTGLSQVVVLNTLKLLERDGIISLSDAFETPSRVLMKASRDELFRLRENNPQMWNVVDCLLRTTQGLFSDFAVIKEENIAARTQMRMCDVVSTLKRLANENYLEYAERSDKPTISFVTEFLDASALKLTDEVYRDRRREAEERINAVVAFVNNDEECRSTQLLRYFGEKIDHACQHCDVCASRAGSNVSSKEFKEIKALIINVLKEKGKISLKEIPQHIPNYLDEKIFSTLWFLRDEGRIQIIDDSCELVEGGR